MDLPETLPSTPRVRRAPGVSCVLAIATVALAGCTDDGPAGLGSLRFGQIGEVDLLLEAPLLLGAGELRQRLRWSSEGPFLLTEEISYRGELGDRTEIERFENPEVLAGSYAQWIVQVNEVDALDLFIDGLDPALDPSCGQGRTRITLRITDDPRGESISWTRCVLGSLATLQPGGAGPEPAAARVAAAALLLREQALGSRFTSTYDASVPFATIDKGEDTGADINQPRAVVDAEAWEAFWAEHRGDAEPRPEVDFERDLVVVAAVGVRFEAGDSVEVRRVLPVDQSTIVTIVERVPGNFCSPAERRQTPFHIVRVPRVPLPMIFADVEVERVPCGL